MSTNKFLSVANGIYTLFTAIAASTGAADANKIPMTDSSGKFDISLMPTGIGPSTVTVLASEALSAGDFVNIYNNAGTANCRKADGANGRPADGFVLAAVANAANATVYLQGNNTALSGLIPGENMFLSATTAGTATATAPNATGNILQRLGRALNATTIVFESDPYVNIL